MLIKINNDFITIKSTNKHNVNIIELLLCSIDLLTINANQPLHYAEIKKYHYIGNLKLTNFLQFYYNCNDKEIELEKSDYCFKPIHIIKNNDVTGYYGDIFKLSDEDNYLTSNFTIDNVNYYERNCQQIIKLVHYFNVNKIQ